VFIAGGAGGVGALLIKLLRTDGVHRIYTTAGNEASRQALLAIGLFEKQILDYRTPDFVQQALNRNGQAFDYCIDLVGGIQAEVCAGLLSIHGSYADITSLGTPASREALFDKGATVYNISNYAVSLANDPKTLSIYGQNLQRLTELIEAGAITPPLVSVVGPLQTDTVRMAHSLLETNQSKGKKLVMTIP
ncbi:MAG TPA: zinc-binding dehydrogenase, partial [Chitinophagaceae bacterium]|nr:zinc-binding dehydrogenase [Chitinophagaceae bacterium]